MKKGISKFMALTAISALTLTACGPKKFAENLPEVCPDNNEIEVASKKVSSFDLTSSHFITWDDLQGSLVFTNFEGFDPSSIYGHDLVEGEARVVVKLRKEDGEKLTTGKYEGKYGKDEAPNFQVPEFNISTHDLAGGVWDKEGYVQIDYISTDFVCGSIKADDGSAKIVGNFVSHFVKN